MTTPFLTALAIPGTMRAHDDLRTACTLWRLSEASFNASPTPANAKAADAAFQILVAHALNCGMELREPDYVRWIVKRLASYMASLPVASRQWARASQGVSQ